MQDIEAVDRSAPVPASITQHERLDAGRYVHRLNNILQVALAFDGEVDSSALVDSIADLARRHEVLRAHFPVGEKRPHVISLAAELPAPEFVDLSATAAAEEQAMAWLRDFLSAPFDLGKGPLFRAIVIRVHAHRYLVGLPVDHVIGDGISCAVLRRDLLEFYAARVERRAPAVPPLALQFLDYADWEARRLQSGGFDRSLSYWKSKLSGVDAIPYSGLVDPAAEEGRTPDLGVLRFKVAGGLRAGLSMGNSALRATPYTLVSAAVMFSAAALRGEGRTDDGSVDMPLMTSVPNRPPGLKDAFGYFANISVLRTVFSAEATVASALQDHGTSLLGSLRHQSLSHSLILRQHSPHLYGVRYGPDLERIPRYVNFDMSGELVEISPQIQGVTVTELHMRLPEVPRGGIFVRAKERPDQIAIMVRYRTDWYSEEWIARFARGIERALEGFVRGPGEKVSALVASLRR